MSWNDVSWKDAFITRIRLQFDPSRRTKLVRVFSATTPFSTQVGLDCFFVIDSSRAVWKVNLDGTTFFVCDTVPTSRFYLGSPNKIFVSRGVYGLFDLIEKTYCHDLNRPWEYCIPNYTGIPWYDRPGSVFVDCSGETRASFDPTRSLPVYYSETGPVWGLRMGCGRDVIAGPNQFLSVGEEVWWRQPNSEYIPGIPSGVSWTDYATSFGFVRAKGFTGRRVMEGLVFQGRTYLLINSSGRLYVTSS